MSTASKSSDVYWRKKHAASVLRPLEQVVASLAVSRSAIPATAPVHVICWNGQDRAGTCARITIHPQKGLYSWSAVVANMFQVCQAGLSDDTVYAADGSKLSDFAAFLRCYAKEKERHDLQYSQLLFECHPNARFLGPRAAVPERPEDDAVPRAFHMDVICCTRGAPFRVPVLLMRYMKRREALERSAVERGHLHSQQQLVLSDSGAAEAAKARQMLHRGPSQRSGSPSLGGGDRCHVMAGYVLTSRRKDQRTIIIGTDEGPGAKNRGTDLSGAGMDEDSNDDTRPSSPTAASGGADVLMARSSRLRRMSSANRVLLEGSMVVDRARAMRDELMATLRKEETVEGALSSEELQQMRTGLLSKRGSLLSLSPSPKAGTKSSPMAASTETVTPSTIGVPRRSSRTAGESASTTEDALLASSLASDSPAHSQRRRNSSIFRSRLSSATRAGPGDSFRRISSLRDLLHSSKDSDPDSESDPNDDVNQEGGLHHRGSQPPQQQRPASSTPCVSVSAEFGTLVACDDEPSPIVRSAATQQRSASSLSASHIPFPLGVVSSRLNERIKIDGGPIRAGSLVTSARTGELYRVEWVDPIKHIAHCRWVVRAIDPMLADMVECSENSFRQRLHLGTHFQKYRLHWLRRMNVVAKQHLTGAGGGGGEQGATTGSATAENNATHGDPPSIVVDPADAAEGERYEGTNPKQRGDVACRVAGLTLTPSDLDDSMLQFGNLPEAVDMYTALSRYHHHASPSRQRRQLVDSDNSDDDDMGDHSTSSAVDRDEGSDDAVVLSEEDKLAIKDFEALFTYDRAAGLTLSEAVRKHAPTITVSRQVSFLTDVCVNARLGHLKPTTTFRFLLWMDLGFVMSLKSLLHSYSAARSSIASTNAPNHSAATSLPIPREDLITTAVDICGGGNCVSLDGNEQVVRLRNATMDRYLHTDPVESCLGHESAEASIFIDAGRVDSTKDASESKCCTCGAITTAAQQSQDPPGLITMLM